jgi:menaquinone-dependent protoporphyrinogen oxidase
MSVLVTYASKHGATKGIAERIAAKLQKHWIAVDIRPIEDVTKSGGYTAFVIGGALYYGSWMKDATEFVRRNRAALAQRPVWLFSSGPLGEEVNDEEQQPKELAELQEAIRPRDHRVFFGALDRDKLSFIERMVIKGVRAPTGDFRDWNEIDAWSESIAQALTPVEVSPSEM